MSTDQSASKVSMLALLTPQIVAEPCHYAVLGVSTDATDKEIKLSYRLRSLQVRERVIVERNYSAGGGRFSIKVQKQTVV